MPIVGMVIDEAWIAAQRTSLNAVLAQHEANCQAVRGALQLVTQIEATLAPMPIDLPKENVSAE